MFRVFDLYDDFLVVRWLHPGFYNGFILGSMVVLYSLFYNNSFDAFKMEYILDL